MKEADTIRLIKFIFICIPARILIIILAFLIGNFEEDDILYRFLFSAFTTIIGCSMLAAAFKREQDVIIEHVGFNGGVVYWNSAVHGMLYILFSLLFLINTFESRLFEHSWLVLVIDLFVGAITVLVHYTTLSKD